MFCICFVSVCVRRPQYLNSGAVIDSAGLVAKPDPMTTLCYTHKIIVFSYATCWICIYSICKKNCDHVTNDMTPNNIRWVYHCIALHCIAGGYHCIYVKLEIDVTIDQPLIELGGYHCIVSQVGTIALHCR